MLIFVVYDGIANSVFDGQVLQPLVKKLTTKATNKVLIISYEKVQPSPEVCAAITAAHPHLQLIILKKYPFMGKLSLLPAIRSLKKIFMQHTAYQLMARGPLAGFICARAVDWTRCLSLTVQARGLVAEEHRYVTQGERNMFKRVFNQFRIKLFTSLEKTAYTDPRIIIEAVSPALKEFLITTMGARANAIHIAAHDIPPTIHPATVATWRHTTRMKLSIPDTAYVYCFNGSTKPWQCADDVVRYFEQIYAADTNNFLLVLTQNAHEFQALLSARPLPQCSYKVLSVPHTDMYRYLSACDAGLIFRQTSIVNWVSRPTKVLEYQAVGLKVIHNNTIALLEKTF